MYLFIDNPGLVSLFNCISTSVKRNRVEKYWFCLIDTWRDKEVYAFPKGINLKVNVIMWLEFELAYSDVAVLHASYYTKRTTPCCPAH